MLDFQGALRQWTIRWAVNGTGEPMGATKAGMNRKCGVGKRSDLRLERATNGDGQCYATATLRSRVAPVVSPTPVSAVPTIRPQMTAV